MSIRTRPFHALLLTASLALGVVGCQSLKVETPTNYEALQDASDAHLAYARGDCETVETLTKPDRLRSWEASEIRFSMQLLNGFCKELAGDVEGAREVYDDLIKIQPNSFSARDAQERLIAIRINESDPEHARRIESARNRAIGTQATRAPVERKPAIFPPVARMTGIEGYAVVEFGVTPRGRTSYPVIIDSKPPFLFDGAALRAVRGWEYARDFSASGDDTQIIRLVFVTENATEDAAMEAEGMSRAIDSEPDLPR